MSCRVLEVLANCKSALVRTTYREAAGTPMIHIDPITSFKSVSHRVLRMAHIRFHSQGVVFIVLLRGFTPLDIMPRVIGHQLPSINVTSLERNSGHGTAGYVLDILHNRTDTSIGRQNIRLETIFA